jgi:hypothetical protein
VESSKAINKDVEDADCHTEFSRRYTREEVTMSSLRSRENSQANLV